MRERTAHEKMQAASAALQRALNECDGSSFIDRHANPARRSENVAARARAVADRHDAYQRAVRAYARSVSVDRLALIRAENRRRMDAGRPQMTHAEQAALVG